MSLGNLSVVLTIYRLSNLEKYSILLVLTIILIYGLKLLLISIYNLSIALYQLIIINYGKIFYLIDVDNYCD